MALILGLAFFLNLFGGSLLQLLHFRWGLFLSQMLFIAAPALAAIRWFYLDRGRILPFGPVAVRTLVPALLGAAGLYHLLTLLLAAQQRLLPGPPPLRPALEELLTYRGPAEFVVVLFLAGAVVPVCEEILFRGFVQAGFVRALESAPKGIAATALAFAVFHLDPWRFAPTLVLGIFLGVLAHRSRDLVPAILAHSTNNVLAIGAGALGPASAEWRAAPWSLGGALLLLAVASFLLGRRPACRRRGRVL